VVSTTVIPDMEGQGLDGLALDAARALQCMKASRLLDRTHGPSKCFDKAIAFHAVHMVG
jgi:hypothetical protein